jgi:hypothetical protein
MDFKGDVGVIGPSAPSGHSPCAHVSDAIIDSRNLYVRLRSLGHQCKQQGGMLGSDTNGSRSIGFHEVRMNFCDCKFENPPRAWQSCAGY